MKKLLCILPILGMLLSGCLGPGTSDWSYALPNGYEIWRVNSRSIHCLKVKGSGGTAVLDQYVSAFSYGQQYVGLQCVAVPEDLNETIDTSDPTYYLLDTSTGSVTGPYTQEEYAAETGELESMCDWIPTRPAPEGANYD